MFIEHALRAKPRREHRGFQRLKTVENKLVKDWTQVFTHVPVHISVMTSTGTSEQGRIEREKDRA